jgi:hypothetical protein
VMRITEVSKSTEVIPKSAEVAQPGRALDSKPQGLRAKLKTGSSPVQTRPSAPQLSPPLSARVRVKLKVGQRQSSSFRKFHCDVLSARFCLFSSLANLHTKNLQCSS